MSVRARWLAVAGLAALGLLAFEVVSTQPVRGAVRTFNDLVQVANGVGLPDERRLAMARGLCSRRYLASHALEFSPEGGLVGLPRAIDKNFAAWREGPDVWICPTKRTSRERPVYRFVREDGRWKFDGPVAILRPGGEILPAAADATTAAEEP
ncbi:hypothetical protein OJF2_48260 [Aquisphaera giovannonii]|uniref:Uncharacterized protein n=1 Tax=Aquisphaera giovannonii TaxID=406548 RepID=A0A5B9W6H3_9BACT|nr:hypothetical protein [Aquisphaera giovannonii]QEH36266.1 hypothetical protein OJF2_48260 [Aquisphaera giovannonii]